MSVPTYATYQMRSVIGEYTKAEIIKQWMSGKSRDAIVQSIGVSAGVVSNVIAMWRTALGIPVAEELRELAVGLSKLNLRPSDCAIGARILSVMRSLGLNDQEEVEEFLSDTYRQSKELGILPETIAENLKQLIDLCATVPIIELPIYLMQKRHEKLELEAEIERLRSQQLKAKKLAEDAINQQQITVSELQNYLSFKREMAYNEISMDDIAAFMKIVQVIKKTTDLHPSVVVSKFRIMDNVTLAQIYLDQLKGEIKQLTEEKETHTQILKTYKELESHGVGLKELKLLANTVREISNANGIPQFIAITKFCSHIEENYDTLLGLESKLEELRSQIRDEKLKLTAMQSQSYGFDWASFSRLFQAPTVQGQATVTSKGQGATNKENSAGSESSIRPDAKAAPFGVTSPAQGETKRSSEEKLKSEKGDDITDEQVLDFQARLQNKYGKPRDFVMNATLATQEYIENPSQDQSKYVNGDGFIDVQLHRLHAAADLLQNKNSVDFDLDDNVNST